MLKRGPAKATFVAPAYFCAIFVEGEGDGTGLLN